jgi:hypothetical protein
MKPSTAATFAIDTVKAVKQSMIENGIADAQFIYAACNKLAAMLSLPVETIVNIFEQA